ncbi:hypothetical protein [Kiloniella majae]|uniref:hypothetical protein n=1 Tax=Kiloniella majae TaxID=1938558 RepID=UPI000A278463|nr:hypothetical protein [Kiloniella majae]
MTDLSLLDIQSQSMKKILIALFVLASVIRNSAHAVELDGANDPQFKAAIESWLDDDDKTSLPILAKLAKTGNVAARLTLSGIERLHIQSVSPYFKSLTRKEQRSLMRAGGGLSGTSWLNIEAERGHQLAFALLRVQAPNINQILIRKLIDLGERETASRQIPRIINSLKSEQIFDLADDHFVPKERRHRVWQTAAFKGNQKYIDEANRALRNGDPLALMGSPNRTKNADFKKHQNAIYFGAITEEAISEEYKKGLKKWFVTSTELKPVSQLCNVECPKQMESCTAMAYKLINGYHNVTNHDTPLESVISQADFINSAKSINTLLRHILQRKKGITNDGEIYFATYSRLIYLKDIRAASSCLADKLATLQY